MNVSVLYIKNKACIVTSDKAGIRVGVVDSVNNNSRTEVLNRRSILLRRRSKLLNRRGILLLLLDDSDTRGLGDDKIKVWNKAKSLVKVVMMLSWPNNEMCSLLVRSSLDI